MQIFTTPLPPAAEDAAVNEAALADAKAELIRTVGGSITVIDLASLPVAQAAASDGEYVFVAGEITSRIPAATATSLDVRDKGDLAVRRRALARDVLFWRVAVGCVLALALLGVGELALLVGRATWQQSRVAQFNAQKPTVEKIMNAQALATRIEDLSTKRLLPMEMISLVAAKKAPFNLRFSRVVTDAKDLERVIIDALTENSGEIPLFKSALEALPEVVRVDITNQRGAQTITFKPGAIQPAAAP